MALNNFESYSVPAENVLLRLKKIEKKEGYYTFEQ